MNVKDIKSKAINGAKWSGITEISTKVVTPITNMILARLLAPEAFGVVAIITMIMSFLDMLTDSGFQKYIVQHEFNSEDEKNRYINVAFWTNLSLSVIIYLLIVLLRDKVAYIVGSPNLGNVIAIALIQLPMTSFSSIQKALLRRDFQFKLLFNIQMIMVFIPFFITIPLAIIGLSYWSLIIALIFKQFLLALMLTIKSSWKPYRYYDFIVLKKMFAFCSWSLVEAISIWMTVWIDSFIIANLISSYYLGLFKTSTILINSIMGVITSSIRPVLYSTLSRIKQDDKLMKEVYLKVQLMTSVIIFPAGIGIFIYRDFITYILLGDQWNEASLVIGLWGLTSAINIVLGYFSTDYYRAIGKPQLSFVSQILHLLVLVPSMLISIKFGFVAFVIVRSVARLEMVFQQLIIMQKIFKIKISKTILNVSPVMLSTAIMAIFAFLVRDTSDSKIFLFCTILLCIPFYFGILYLFPSMKVVLKSIRDKILIEMKKIQT